MTFPQQLQFLRLKEIYEIETSNSFRYSLPESLTTLLVTSAMNNITFPRNIKIVSLVGQNCEFVEPSNISHLHMCRFNPVSTLNFGNFKQLSTLSFILCENQDMSYLNTLTCLIKLRLRVDSTLPIISSKMFPKSLKLLDITLNSTVTRTILLKESVHLECLAIFSTFSINMCFITLSLPSTLKSVVTDLLPLEYCVDILKNPCTIISPYYSRLEKIVSYKHDINITTFITQQKYSFPFPFPVDKLTYYYISGKHTAFTYFKYLGINEFYQYWSTVFHP